MTRTIQTSLTPPTNDRAHARSMYRVYEEQCISDPLKPVSERQYGAPAIGYVIAGWCDYRASGGAITAVPGAVVFGNEGEHYEVDHHECPGNRRLVVRYSRTFLRSVAEVCEIDCPRFGVVGLPPGKGALKVFNALRAMIRGGEDGEVAAVSLAGTALSMNQAHQRRWSITASDRRRAMSAVRYVENSFSERCSIDTLARISGLSRYYFIRLFKQVTGQSPNQYVINTRLRAGATRLMQTRAPVSQIALDIGFNDISYFNAQFRAAFGCSPRQMRKELAWTPCR
jgi:AraC family transcriptional regulator